MQLMLTASCRSLFLLQSCATWMPFGASFRALKLLWVCSCCDSACHLTSKLNLPPSTSNLPLDDKTLPSVPNSTR